jgi:hypothetical protein
MEEYPISIRVKLLKIIITIKKTGYIKKRLEWKCFNTKNQNLYQRGSRNLNLPNSSFLALRLKIIRFSYLWCLKEVEKSQFLELDM